MRLSQKQNKKLSKTFDVPAPVFLGESRASRMLEKQPMSYITSLSVPVVTPLMLRVEMAQPGSALLPILC